MPEKTNRISFQGELRRQFRHRLPQHVPGMEPLPCQTFEDAFNAVETGKADLAMIPIENTIAGRVADIHHLLPESTAAHRRRIFPADPLPADGAAGREARRDQHRAQPYPCARSVPQDHPRQWLEAGGRRRYGGCGQAGGRDQGDRTMAALAPRARRRSLRARDHRGECRGHRKQRHPLRRAVREQAMGSSARRRTSIDDNLHLPRPQHSGRALQGAWAVLPPTAST